MNSGTCCSTHSGPFQQLSWIQPSSHKSQTFEATLRLLERPEWERHLDWYAVGLDLRCENQMDITKFIKCDMAFSQPLYILGDMSLLDDLPIHNAAWVQVALTLWHEHIIPEWRQLHLPCQPPERWFSQISCTRTDLEASKFNVNDINTIYTRHNR